MKKYDTYKDSGNQWIGQVPEHWKILPIKYCAELFTGNSISDRDKENYLDSTDAIPYIATKDINAQTLLADYENGMYTKKEDASFKIASKGSTLLCIEGGSAGRKKTYLTEDVSFVNKLCCFTAKENMSGKYLYYYINSNEFVETFNNHVTGLIGGVSLSSLVNFKSPLPPLSEQQAIVEFLDKKTGQIDKSIALLETQKTDLQAYRQALITETVTKGLNPNTPLKDSGIQWIGEIPEGWEMKRLKHFTALLTDGTHQTPIYLEEGVPFLSIKDISTGKIDFSDVKYISEEEHLALQAHAPVEKGDIIFTRIGTLGVFLKVDTDIVFDIFVSVGLIKLIPNSVNADYLVYYLSSNMIQEYISFTKVGEGTSAPKINLTNAKNMPIITPPLSEQQAIVEYLDKKTSDIDTAIQKINTQIADLQAYRTALISEAVTGKIDVRNQ